MGFLVPAALGFLALIPAIVALYFLRLRRQERTVTSTWLWQEAGPDQRANRPWQRLRWSWLLFLQVLAALALALAASHPFRPVTASGGGNVAVLLDGTAAMHAADGRWQQAVQAVEQLIAGMAPGDRMSLILLTRSPEVLAAASGDRRALRAALASARPGLGDGDLAAGLDLALSLIRGRPDPEVVVVGSGRYLNGTGLPPVPVPVRYIPVGGPLPNLAVTAFGSRARDGIREALAQVTNFGPAAAAAPIQLWADGALVAAAQQTLGPGETRAFTWPLPAGARLLEVRLPVEDGLAADNRAWSLVGGPQRGRVLLVSPGNPFVAAALKAVAGLEVTVQAPGPYDATGYDLVVLDGWDGPPAGPPAAGTAPGSGGAGPAVIRLAPPSGPLVAVTAPVTPAAADSLLDHVDARQVHVAAARQVEPPPTARVLWRAGDLPLLWVDGREVTFAFDLRDSDLPLQPAFPILMRNILDRLLPPSPVHPAEVQPGQPVTLRPWPGTERLEITAPDGTVHRWPAAEAAELPFTGTDQPGLYTVAEVLGGGRERRSQFAVNLFSHLASNLTPAPELDLPVSPEVPPPAPRTVPADIWPYLAALALGVVALEWWVYRRGLAL